MKHAEFIQYLSEIEDLNSKQRKQLSAVLQGKNKNPAVIKTLEASIWILGDVIYEPVELPG